MMTDANEGRLFHATDVEQTRRSSHGYAVGDRVRMKQTLTAAASDELPAQHFCDQGEVLIVREVTEEHCPRNGVWPVYVSHEDITDRFFGVNLDEIEAT